MSTRISRDAWARLAGAMFLFVIAVGLLNMAIVGPFGAPAFAETGRRIAAAQLRYRMGVALPLLGGLGTVLLALGLYGLLEATDRTLALAALAFRLVEAANYGIQAILTFGLLSLYLQADQQAAFAPEALAAIRDVRAAAGGAGYNISALFFGVGSILFFRLFLESRCIPYALAVLGFVGSLLIPPVCLAGLLFPGQGTLLLLGWIPIAVAEVTVGVRLLIKGAGGRSPVEAGEPRERARA